MTKIAINPQEYQRLYQNFNAPITALDCGKRCSPHNVGGKPFCCDICHSVPTAYENEWGYLKNNTNLWFEWQAESCVETREEAQEEFESLRNETPDNMVLLECLGPNSCERDYRTLTCRQFPFFPYVDSKGNFLGLSYYWEYEDTCWVISNLQVVSAAYQREFIDTFEIIFKRMPKELDSFQYHSEYMRNEFNDMGRKIPLLHQDGNTYQINPNNEALNQIEFKQLPKFGPYEIVADMPFPDEIE